MAVLVDVDYEVGDTSEHDSVTGSVSVTSPAALAGTTKGLQIDLDGADVSARFGRSNFTYTSDVIRWRIYLDLNSLTVGGSDEFFVTGGYTGGTRKITLSVEWDGADYQIHTNTVHDGGSTSGADVTLTDAEVYIEIEMDRSAGTTKLWVDGALEDTVSGMTISTTTRPTHVRVGGWTLDTGTSGTYYIDQLVLNDDGSEIGAFGGGGGSAFVRAVGSTVRAMESLGPDVPPIGTDTVKILSPAAVSSLHVKPVTTDFRVEVVDGRGILFNPSADSGSRVAGSFGSPSERPYKWVHGTSPPVIDANYIQSGGILGEFQVGVRISSGTSALGPARGDPSNGIFRWKPTFQQQPYHSGDQFEWEISYKIPNENSAPYVNFFDLLIVTRDEQGNSLLPIHTSGTTSGVTPSGYVFKKGTFATAAESGVDTAINFIVGMITSGTTIDGDDQFSDPNFEVDVDHMQFRVIREIPYEDITSYSVRKSTDFLSSTGEVTLKNEGGKYGSGERLQVGDELRVYERVHLPDGGIEELEKFRGKVKDRRITNQGGISSVKITAFDPLIALDDMDIENFWQGETATVKEDFLLPTNLPDPPIVSGSKLASIWTASNAIWATDPPPTVQLTNDLGYPYDDQQPGFQTFLEAGQLLFERPLNTDATLISASYDYYIQPLHVEEVIEGILASGDGFGFAPFTYDYHLRSTFSNERSGVDVLTTNLETDTLPIRFRVESAGLSDGDYARIYVDGLDFSLNAALSYNVVNVNSGGKAISIKSYSVTSNADMDTMSGDFLAMQSGTYALVATRGTPDSPHISGGNAFMFQHLGARLWYRFFSGSIWEQVGFYDSGSYAFIGQVGKSPLSGVIPEVLTRTAEGPSKTTIKVNPEYGPGRIWFTRFNRWHGLLTTPDFTVPASTSFERFNARLGAIVLSGENVDINSTVLTETDYEFSTIQATGIELTEFRTSFDDPSRLDAIRKLRDSVLPPNYIIRSEGQHIWGGYFNQKTLADYELSTLTTGIEQTGDEDVFTRVKVFGVNENPINLGFDPATTVSDKIQTITGSVTDTALHFEGEAPGGFRIYSSAVSGSGRIFSRPRPNLTINAVEVRLDESQQLAQQPVNIYVKVTHNLGGFGLTVFQYQIGLSHQQIDEDGEIVFQDAVGNNIFIISPGASPDVFNYDRGIFRVPAFLAVQSSDSVLRFHAPIVLDNPIPAGTEINSLNILQPIGVAQNARAHEKRFVFSQSQVMFLPTDALTDAAPDQPGILAQVDSMTFDGFFDLGPVHGLRFPPSLARFDFPQHRWVGKWIVNFETTVVLPKKLLDYRAADDGDSYLSFQLVGAATMFGSSFTRDGAFLGISTADYRVLIESEDVQIRHEDGEFWISEGLFPARLPSTPDNPDPPDAVVASFHFATAVTPIDPNNATNMLTGDPQAQSQLIYQHPVVPGTVFTTIDLGSVLPVDAIDIVPGFFVPPDDVTGVKKFDVSFRMSLLKSDDGTTFSPISQDTQNVDLKTGDKLSVDQGVLGSEFETRFLRIVLNGVDRNFWRGGAWPVSIAQFAIYRDITVKGVAKLVPAFTGSGDIEVLDTFNLRDRIGDRLFKIEDLNDTLDTQAKVDERARLLLVEFNKNHTRATSKELYHPGISQGQTIRLIDPVNSVERNYFVEEVVNRNGLLDLRLAFFP